jgi:anti-sigma factor (TIGR02949 family)
MTRPGIDCAQALKRIFEFIDHELDEGDHEVMHRHLEVCKSCFSRMEFEQRLKEKLGRLRDEQPTHEVTERVKGLLQSFG